MPHGTGDWADLIARSTVFGGIDLSELAVRLGSNNLWDRRGDTLFCEDFESGIEGVETIAGADGSVEWSCERCRGGGFSIKFTTPKTFILLDRLQKWLPCPVKSAIGGEVSVCTDDAVVYFEWLLRYYDGVDRYEFGIRYTLETEILEYYDGDWHNFAEDVKFYKEDYLFHTAKVVGDVRTGKYVRFIFDNVTYPMSKYSGYKVECDTTPVMDFKVEVLGTDEEHFVWWADDLIITQNEP